MVEYVKGHTYHGRLGKIRNSFTYKVDFVFFDENDPHEIKMFSHNKVNLFSIFDRDHGGLRNFGKGFSWARDIFSRNQIDLPEMKVKLLAQPRMFLTRFTPVSFWMAFDAKDKLIAVIVEVNNTFGDRHSYLCYNDDLSEITQNNKLITSKKALHVSPFQPMEGAYKFSFDINAKQIFIRINYNHDSGGVVATLEGKRSPLTSKLILIATFMRPFGSARVLFLIHFQALRLWIKKATFSARPKPPTESVSR
ncbi:MAG: DUF1365 domain-containing protein [Paracoccaceae bacterium]|nr:cyclopropane-fatty-acyl-phospholipid synthase [Paracoccaceae bacterium]|tara:strand:+ start:1118 stop:1870 length:753 start_codon:yes stop_codon:yes gene_type:complete